MSASRTFSIPELCGAYEKLDQWQRSLLQALAVLHEPISSHTFEPTLRDLGIPLANKPKRTYQAAAKELKNLAATGLIEAYRSSYSIATEIHDFVIQDSVRQGTFQRWQQIASKRYTHSLLGDRSSKELRLAFYGGDVANARAKLARNGGAEAQLLTPFSRDIFDRLPPILQQMYLGDVVPRMVATAEGDPQLLEIADDVAARVTKPEDSLLAAMLDLAIARGSLGQLEQLDRATQGKCPEIAGCAAMLRGDSQQAVSLLHVSIHARKSKSPLSPALHLPGQLYLLLRFKESTSASVPESMALISQIIKAGVSPFADAQTVTSTALRFKQSPTSPRTLANELKSCCDSPLATLLTAYYSKWLLSDGDHSWDVAGIANAARTFRGLGFDWLAAEALSLAGTTSLKGAEAHAQQGHELHTRLQTASYVRWIEPEPVWARTLDAISNLGEGRSRTTAIANEVSERLIFEFNPQYGRIYLEVYQQSRTKGDVWSKGRKVALQRLFESFMTPSFGFLTEQDRALCRCLRSWTARNRYGYSETYCEFDEETAATALIGHPRIFQPGDREHPLEITELPPRLVAMRTGPDAIQISLEPKPKYDTESIHIVKNGPRQISITLFDEQHQNLRKLLGGTLTVPSSALEKVVGTLQRVSSLVMVHSEVGEVPSAGAGTDSLAVAVQGDPRPQLHLLPWQEGLKIEFHVRPFGNEGPFFPPGAGGANLYATIKGQSQSAKRDLAEERKLVDDCLAVCPELASRVDQGLAAFCPTPMEALPVLLELEDLASSQRLTLHWPQGKTLQVAGRASASQFRLSIGKDRDWFAATGALKVDSQLSLDLMQLVGLVEASPSRFVQLDDGRFLALTEQLLQRIEDLASFGDRHSKKGRLRFSRVHAPLLSDLGDIKVKADTHWKTWLQRMRAAEQVSPEVPATLQTELRDYQVEGFRWLARLAAWGVGGCLADDMGLGKTIEAIALLLHRSAEGPALVVAPTSVIYNWTSELRRFAPTLNPIVFGESDRKSLFRSLGPRDVVVCSYGLLNSESDQFQAAVWNTLILDEGQAIKNLATQRSQAAKGLQADFRLIMTGTPMENHLGELWNLMDFVNPGLLGTAESFQSRFAIPIQRDQCRESRRRLKKLIQPFILRRTKSQVLQELPPRTEVTLHVELGAEEAALYEALRLRALEKLANVADGKPQHLLVLAEIMRLRRACCHPSLVAEGVTRRGSKLDLFSKTIDGLLDNQHRVLVFSQFVDHLTILREELDKKQISYQYLDGSTTAKQRKERVEAFQSGQGNIFLISLKAGGLGLNLTGADYVIHMDPWWNPAVEDQASDRAHRLGQLRPVTIYRMITKGTIEERISELHTTKRDLAESLLEGTDISGKLSTAELLKLIRA